MSINWKQKLSSRKFWAGVAAFVTSLITAFNIQGITIEQATVVISGIGALCVYMLAEGTVDKNRPPENK